MALFPFGGQSPFDMFNEDQPFGGMMQHFSSMMDPFSSMFGRGGHPLFPSPFGMNMNNMNNMIDVFRRDLGDKTDLGHSYSTSTVMTMSSGPDGRPQIYQESRSTRTAPGGITETKKSVCDSRSGTKRMAIGHHIGERAHVRERLQNIHSGENEEMEDFINIDEDDAEEFDNEWKRKASNLGYRADSRRSRPLAITSGRYRPRSTTTSQRSYPALTYNSQEVDNPAQESEPEIIAENPRKRQREENAKPYDTKKSLSKKKDGRNANARL